MKILVPLDGSSKSETVLPLAGRLAASWQAEILALRVTDPAWGALDPAVTSLSESAYQRVMDEGKNYLNELSQRYPELPLKTLHQAGSVPVCIEEVARKEKCELIMMATHGQSGLVRWLWGSVAEGVARHAPCPAMLVRAAETPVLFREILLPTDGSEESLSVARRIGKYLGAETRVTLLHCTGNTPEPEAAEMRAHLQQQVDGRPWMRLELVSGTAPGGILDWLAGHDCDLIAMSTHGREGLAHLWNGSVMEDVTRHSECPVLVFPPSVLKENGQAE